MNIFKSKFIQGYFYLWNIRGGKRTMIATDIGMVCLILSFINISDMTPNPYQILFSMIGASALFVAFDVFGHHFMTTKEGVEYDPVDYVYSSYRILQLIFQTVILLFILIPVSYYAAIIWMFMHWGGVHDFLYYKFLGSEIPDNMTWVSWTPIGLVTKYILNRDSVSPKTFVAQAVITLILSGGMFYWFILHR